MFLGKPRIFHTYVPMCASNFCTLLGWGPHYDGSYLHGMGGMFHSHTLRISKGWENMKETFRRHKIGSNSIRSLLWKKDKSFWYVTEHVSDLTWGYLSYDMHLGIHSFNSINSYRLSYILIYNHIIYKYLVGVIVIIYSL